MNTEVPIKRRNLIGGGVIVAALLVMQPLKEYFVTREEGHALDQRITALQLMTEANHEEMTRSLERSTDKIIERLDQAEERVRKNLDKVESRVQSLEAARIQQTKSMRN